MTHKNIVTSLIGRAVKFGALLGVAAMLGACETDGPGGQTSGPSASSGTRTAGAGSSIQNVPANPGSVPNGVNAFPANAGGGPR